MNITAYVVKTETSSLDKELKKLIEGRDLRIEELDIHSDHGAIINILKDREPGIVFIPTEWLDMFCVKVLNGIVTLKSQFETIIFGPTPDMSYLIAAYNSGLSAFVEMPTKKDLFAQVVTRLKNRLAEKIAVARDLNRLREFERGGAPAAFSPQILERDQFIAKAFMDIMSRSGPLFDGNVSVLLVSSSHAQQQAFEAFLKTLGIKVMLAGGVGEAIKILSGSSQCKMVISDGVLPDGSAATLVEKLRKSMTSELPRFAVITASPDKAGELLAPEMHIDDVIVKPAPDAGMESILPTIIAGIYQTRSV